MASVTISFSILEEDLPSLNHLVEVFAQGNRSAFLRIAMRQMEILERAERLDALSAYGDERLAAKGLTVDDIPDVVHRVLTAVQRDENPTAQRRMP